MASEEYNDEVYEEERFSEQEDRDDEHDDEDEGEGVASSTILARTTPPSSAKKNEVIRVLIKCFSSMVRSDISPTAIPDHKGRFLQKDMTYTKLFDASKYVIRAKSELRKNDDVDVREFTIFIAKKKWMKDILCPLLELCAKDDSTLAITICGLLLWLLKRMTDPSYKALADLQKKSNSSKLMVEIESSGRKKLVSSELITQQIWALCTFKEALCSEKGNDAITNAFKELWEKEQIATDELNKLGVAKCFSYMRRILSIDAHPLFSSPAEHIQNKIAHNKLIFQFRHILAVVPGIIGDILNPYHTDWLVDMVLILYFVLNGFCAQEFFKVWKAEALLDKDDPSTDPNYDRMHQQQQLIAAGGYPKDSVPAPVSSGVTPAQAAAAAAGAVGRGASSKSDIKVSASLARSLDSARGGSSMNNGGGGGLLSKLKSDKAARLAQSNVTGSIVAGRSSKSMFWHKPSSIMAPPPPKRNVDADTVPGALGAPPLNNVPPVHSFDAPSKSDGAMGEGDNKDEGKSPHQLNAENNKKRGISVVSQPINSIVRDPFGIGADGGERLPQAKAKKSKKNLAFKVPNPQVQAAVAAALGGSTGGAEGASHRQKACVVAAMLAHALTNDVVLSSLVKRANEDLRRDENKLSSYLELRYFDVVSKVLHYNRLLLEDQYRRFEFKHSLHISCPAASHTAAVLGYNMSRNSPGGSSMYASPSEVSAAANAEAAATAVPLWEPNFRNVIGSLDRMSFSRVINSITTLLGPKKALTDRSSKRVEQDPSEAILAPMTLYKEMISYLRLLLLSGIEGHHEIAVAALYRLFYTTAQERLDPLPTLLKEWKPGVFPKQYLEVLLDIVHATLQTLDAAKNLFKAELSEELDEEGLEKRYRQICARRRKAKGNKSASARSSESEMEIYLTCSMRFDVDEYFKNRLVSNRTVRIYTKVLALYKDNDIEVNRNVFQFLRRMCQHKIERESLYMGGSHNTVSNLGYMLFNIQTLCVFSDILNDPAINSSEFSAERRPLLNLIRSVVRQFGEAAERNHMLFAEVLLSHSYPADHCLDIASVYNAADNLYFQRQPFVAAAAAASAAGGYSSVDSEEDGEHIKRSRRKDKKDADSSSKKKPRRNKSAVSDSDVEESAADTSSSSSDGGGDDDDDDDDANTKKKKKKNENIGSSEEEEEFDVGLASAEYAAYKAAKDTAKVQRIADKKRKKQEKSSRTTAEMMATTSSTTANATGKKPSRSEALQQKKAAKEQQRLERSAEKMRAAEQKIAERKARMAAQEALNAWTAEEDAVLASLYAKYKGTRSVFSSILYSAELTAFAKKRTEAQVEKRVTQLQLHTVAADDSSSSESDESIKSPGDAAAAAAASIKKKKRVTASDISLLDTSAEAGVDGEENDFANTVGHGVSILNTQQKSLLDALETDEIDFGRSDDDTYAQKSRGGGRGLLKKKKKKSAALSQPIATDAHNGSDSDDLILLNSSDDEEEDEQNNSNHADVDTSANFLDTSTESALDEGVRGAKAAPPPPPAHKKQQLRRARAALDSSSSDDEDDEDVGKASAAMALTLKRKNGNSSVVGNTTVEDVTDGGNTSIEVSPTTSSVFEKITIAEGQEEEEEETKETTNNNSSSSPSKRARTVAPGLVQATKGIAVSTFQ